jgi:hypothetical protein
MLPYDSRDICKTLKLKRWEIDQEILMFNKNCFDNFGKILETSLSVSTRNNFF